MLNINNFFVSSFIFEGIKDDPELLQEEMENNCLTSLYLVMILTKISKKEEKVEFAAMQEIYKLVQLNPLTSTGSSLLHLTVNQQTPVGMIIEISLK